jgi:hypothetical protein
MRGRPRPSGHLTVTRLKAFAELTRRVYSQMRKATSGQ